MLRTFERLIAGKECHCLPFEHLQSFYGQIGFQAIPVELAPPHLQARLEHNLASGERMLVVRRRS